MFSGSPFTANLFDTSQISVDWQSVRTVPVHKPCGFVVTHNGLPPSGLKVTVQSKCFYFKSCEQTLLPKIEKYKLKEMA